MKDFKLDNENILPEIEKYYESIIEKATSYADNNQLEKAIEIIEDELDAPYIPLKYVDALEDLYNVLVAQNRYLKDAIIYEKLNREKLLEIISESRNNIDSIAINEYFDRYHDSLNDEDFDIIQDILISKKIKNKEKVFVVNLLAGFKINKTLKFYNTSLKQEFEINTINTLSYIKSDLYIQTEKIITNLAEKEPSLLNMCYMILDNIFLYNFPNVPDFKSDELAFSIFDYMMSCLEGRNSSNKNTLFEYILKIVNDME